MSVYVFCYQTWASLYPQFATTAKDAQAQLFFNQAEMYCDNTACSLIPYEPPTAPCPNPARGLILDLLTAHIAQLTVGGVIGGALVPAGPLVGRISSATEGSVSVGTAMDLPQSAAWFAQTQFGIMAWQMMAKARTARYRASPGRFFQPNWPVVVNTGPYNTYLGNKG